MGTRRISTEQGAAHEFTTGDPTFLVGLKNKEIQRPSPCNAEIRKLSVYPSEPLVAGPSNKPLHGNWGLAMRPPGHNQ